MRKPIAFGVVNDIVVGTAKKHSVKIYRFANAGNHLHLLLKIPALGAWAAFIRELTGQIAQAMRELFAEVFATNKTQVTSPTSKELKSLNFWKHRPFTRIIRGWKRAFKSVAQYIYLNYCEAEGHIGYRDTKILDFLRLAWADG